MSSWTEFQYGQKTNSTTTMLKQKVQEREEIEMLTAQYLLTKQITQVPYGVRTEKINFQNSEN